MNAAAKPSAPRPERRLDLDRAKGLGILLVVIGHLAAKSQPSGNAWFGYLQTGLYQFHMPFFMYLSGYVCYLTRAARTTPKAWPNLLQRRVNRLLVPFVVFGLALIIGKLVATHFMQVDHAPASFAEAVVAMLWDTDNSPAISVWYIEAVFVLTVITPPLLWATRGKIWLVLLVAGLVYLAPVPHIMYLDKAARFFIFFSLGGAAAEFGRRWLDWIDQYYWIAVAALAIFLAVALVDFDSFSDRTRLFVCGVVSMPALHGLVRRSRLSHSAALLYLGIFSFVIYLLNTPFIGLVKGVLLKFMPWDGVNFLLFFTLMLAAGIMGPILIKRLLFRHVPALDRVTD
jgi:fucose 4-O-acetylase-like acetyltransferase